jgi:hypothetical protein
VVLNASATPDLIDQDLPTATTPGHTLFLKIDLQVDPMGGQPVDPMTAVFAADPKQLPTGNVDVVLWFHGDKRVWSRHRKGTLDLGGKSVQEYLKVDECKLREFVLRPSKKKNFLLVVPTLGDRTGRGPKRTAGGLLWQQAQAEAFLQQVLNGVKTHWGVNVTGLGSVILAAHSGGGHVMGHMAQFFTGLFDKANEVWCFDCTYWGGDPFITWAKRGHSHPRLWVYSTGGQGNGLTGDSASNILTFSRNGKPAATTVEVLIDNYPDAKSSQSTNGFVATYHGSANGHYESIDKYLPQLVEASQNLK